MNVLNERVKPLALVLFPHEDAESSLTKMSKNLVPISTHM